MSAHRVAAAVLAVGVLLAGCSARTAAGESGAAPTNTVGPPRATAQQVVDAFTAAGLDTTQARDTTAADCPSSGCIQAITTTEVVVRTFPTSGRAQIYANSVGIFHVVATSLTFTDGTSKALQQKYETAAKKVAG